MFEAAASGLPQLDLPKIVLAIGSLGTAAYGLVDVSKGIGGGISNCGFGDIRNVVSQLIPAASAAGSSEPALSLTSVLRTLRANWLNGMALADQKAVAKSLIKLNLTEASSDKMAAATGLDSGVLKSIAAKLSGKLDTTQGKPSLEPRETDVYGRFDLLLSAMLDQAYQRADQRYRNGAKLLAVPVAVGLALLGAWAISSQLTCSDIWRAIAAGLLATPLAPVAKDLASAIQEGTKVAQAWKK
jgi:hypothetical protein